MASCYALLAFFLVLSTVSSTATPTDSMTTIYFQANASMSWTNNDDSIPATRFADGSRARIILMYTVPINKSQNSVGHACGFFCSSQSADSCQFSIILVEMNQEKIFTATLPQLVWSANPNVPVGENATLEFSKGNLNLRDSSQVEVWSTGTQSAPVVSMTIAHDANLMLFDATNRTVWQSFDHPSDTLLSRQRLSVGQSLTSRWVADYSVGAGMVLSNLDYSSGGNESANTKLSDGGVVFSISISQNSLVASVHMDISIPYFVLGRSHKDWAPVSTLRYVSITEGKLVFSYGRKDDSVTNGTLPQIRNLPLFHFLRLEPDGSLKAFKWVLQQGWIVVVDLVAQQDPCLPPLKCGQYGVCSRGQCSCPKARNGVIYFDPLDASSLQLGCTQVGSFTSEDKLELVDFGNLSYFAYAYPEAAVPGIGDLDDCKKACMMNDSCLAVFFAHDGKNATQGRCYLPWQMLMMRGDETEGSGNVSSAYLKVTVPFSSSALPPSSSKEAPYHQKWFLPLVISASTILASAVILVLVRCTTKAARSQQEDIVQQIPGMPVRFSYSELCLATKEFSDSIGKGGFGTVFRGVLKDDTLVAVKRLDNSGQGMEEFLTEVTTIGSIRHINLVRLIGFCAEKTHKLLVYEYMCNGSLDSWIFGNKKEELDWQNKRKIILHVAKGLAYLHEECWQKIAHLDVKPHNILLDDKFNSKISDFGLAKFIDRDQSQVSTIVRGTLGYLAPEWQVSEHITVKADIYSFGIVLLEILCARKNLDYSQNDSRIRLLSVLRRNADQANVMDIVHEMGREMHGPVIEELEEEEALRLVGLALWCLHDDYKKRPLMSTVVKVLEGVVEIDSQMTVNVSCTMVPCEN